jgi:hypothetical protein
MNKPDPQAAGAHWRASVGAFSEWAVPRPLRVVWWTIVCLLPLVVVLRAYSPADGFMRLLFYGKQFAPVAIPVVRAAGPPATTPDGYDSQFYSQVAVDPLLRSPEMKTALDMPAYRARRIGLPLLAHILGLGRPAWVLQVFSLLNAAFWYALFIGMHRFLRPLTLRENLCVFAACCTSGAFFSMQRALLDLPAATLAFYAASLAAGSLPALAAAVLTKDTYALAIGALPGFSRGEKHRVIRHVVRALLVVLPLVCWGLYVRAVLGGKAFSGSDYSWPFEGYLAALSHGVETFRKHQTIFAFTEVMAPVSLLVQLAWLLGARRFGCRYWRVGVAFGVASVFLSSGPFVEQMSFCRDTIPMTLAFNIGLMHGKTRAFLPWFIAGNIGLTWGLLGALHW